MPLHVTTHFWIQLHDIRDGSKDTEGIQLVLYTLWQLLSPSLLTQTFLAPLYPTLYVNLPMTELEEGSCCDLSQLLLLPQDLLPFFNEREPIYPPSLILFALPNLCFFWLLLPSLERLDSYIIKTHAQMHARTHARTYLNKNFKKRSTAAVHFPPLLVILAIHALLLLPYHSCETLPRPNMTDPKDRGYCASTVFPLYWIPEIQIISIFLRVYLQMVSKIWHLLYTSLEHPSSVFC